MFRTTWYFLNIYQIFRQTFFVLNSPTLPPFHHYLYCTESQHLMRENYKENTVLLWNLPVKKCFSIAECTIMDFLWDNNRGFSSATAGQRLHHFLMRRAKDPWDFSNVLPLLHLGCRFPLEIWALQCDLWNKQRLDPYLCWSDWKACLES